MIARSVRALRATHGLTSLQVTTPHTLLLSAAQEASATEIPESAGATMATQELPARDVHALQTATAAVCARRRRTSLMTLERLTLQCGTPSSLLDASVTLVSVVPTAARSSAHLALMFSSVRALRSAVTVAEEEDATTKPVFANALMDTLAPDATSKCPSALEARNGCFIFSLFPAMGGSCCWLGRCREGRGSLYEAEG